MGVEEHDYRRPITYLSPVWLPPATFSYISGRLLLWIDHYNCHATDRAADPSNMDKTGIGGIWLSANIFMEMPIVWSQLVVFSSSRSQLLRLNEIRSAEKMTRKLNRCVHTICSHNCSIAATSRHLDSAPPPSAWSPNRKYTPNESGRQRMTSY